MSSTWMDARIPRADEAKETFWYGHSVGHWEGDTLVVDTVGPFFATPKMLLDTPAIRSARICTWWSASIASMPRIWVTKSR